MLYKQLNISTDANLYNELIIPVLNILIFCQDITVPDSTFKVELAPSPPATMGSQWDEFDRAIDEDALMQETCELREEEVDIIKIDGVR